MHAYLSGIAANDDSSTHQKDEADGGESDGAPNDILRDDGGDPQKQAPLCRNVSPDPPASVIEDALQSIVEEPSQSASVLDDEEDGDELDIQGLADALSKGVLPRTPVRSPSPKKVRCKLLLTECSRLLCSVYVRRLPVSVYICLLCLHFVSLGGKNAPLSLRTE
jgi:hypothetical protein